VALLRAIDGFALLDDRSFAPSSTYRAARSVDDDTKERSSSSANRTLIFRKRYKMLAEVVCLCIYTVE